MATKTTLSGHSRAAVAKNLQQLGQHDKNSVGSCQI